ncbi:hypothetical protein [Jannaschia rubra]|uniref:DUF7946 domain-containing protein n=1 Tax=Jannaschia rubra TaxID=282197 RepID=UPI0024916616|nr:hypothetical protein [Jannaschia rubra]
MSGLKYKGGRYPISLTYDGGLSEEHFISLYDLSKALIGFERSLALTTHFVLNGGEVITQVPYLRGARIICSPPEVGSFKVPAYIVSTAMFFGAVGTLEQNNPIGHMIYSLYDLVIHEATGQKVDYNKSLREIYEDGLEQGTEGLVIPRQSQVESLVEKIEPSISDLHRPIVKSETAKTLVIDNEASEETEENQRGGSPILLNRMTYEQLRYRDRGDEIIPLIGKVSSFNMNTFNGRFLTEADARPIPFFLTPAGRSSKGVRRIGESLSHNIIDPNSNRSLIQFDVQKTVTRTGRTAKLSVVKVREAPDDDQLIER